MQLHICTLDSLPLGQHSLTQAKQSSFSRARQQNTLTCSVPMIYTDLFSCHEPQCLHSFVFLTLHWLLYSSKTIQEIMQQNWNLLHKQNRKCSQGLGWLWIPCFTDGYFRLSHISLKKTLTRTKYIILFLFYPNALWSLSYIPIFCLCTNVNEKLQINDINWNGQNKN